jgi:hypothetical protein
MLSSTMPAAKLCRTEFSIRQKNEEALDRYEHVESPNVARFRFYFRYLSMGYRACDWFTG